MMIKIFWYLHKTFGVNNITLFVLVLQILAVLILVYFYFFQRRYFKKLLWTLLIINGICFVYLLWTMRAYYIFIQEQAFYVNRKNDISGNLHFYLKAPLKYENIASNITRGGMDSVDILLECIIESKQKDCVFLLDQTVSRSRIFSERASTEDSAKYLEVELYLRELYGKGSVTEKFYSAWLLRNHYSSDISFERLQELRAQVPKDIPLP